MTSLRSTLSLNVIVISGEQREVCTYMVNMTLGGSRVMGRYTVFQVGSTCSVKPKKAQLHATYIQYVCTYPHGWTQVIKQPSLYGNKQGKMATLDKVNSGQEKKNHCW